MTDVVIQIALGRHHVAHRAGFERRQPFRVERFDALNDLIFGHSGEDQFRSLESEKQNAFSTDVQDFLEACSDEIRSLWSPSASRS